MKLRNPFRTPPIEFDTWTEFDERIGITVYRWQVYGGDDRDYLIEAGHHTSRLGWALRLWLVAMRYRLFEVAA